MMNSFPKTILLMLALSSAASAQRAREPDVPLMRADERQVIEKQALQIADAIRPVARQASQSTLWVYTENPRRRQMPIALATVVGDGTRALTKWSEVALEEQRIYVYGGDGRTARAKVVGVYRDEDLALLELDGANYRPIEWADGDLTPGRFLVAAAPNDEPLGFGVVTVGPHSMREKAYLGVIVNNAGHEGPGVLLEQVESRSAARSAGLRKGDVLLSVDGKALSDAGDVRDAMAGYVPGDRVKVRYRRGSEEREVELELKPKSEFSAFENSRLRVMEEMGGRVNLVRTGFPVAAQMDIKIKLDQCGGPIVDLDGRAVGISVARTDRTHAVMIPSEQIVALLEGKPLSPELAGVRGRDDDEAQVVDAERPPRPRQAQRAAPLERGSAERLRRHLDDMERLMDIMRREMESIGE